MHNQGICETEKEIDVLAPKIGRLSEKVSEVINDYIQINGRIEKN
jgi:hypothetical protein